MATEQIDLLGCSIRAYQNGTRVLVEMSGVLKIQNCEAVKQHLLPLFKMGLQAVYLHLAQMTEIDSAGLGVLVGAHMTARKNKVDFHLLAPTMQQMKMLEATRLTSVLSVIGGMQASEVWGQISRPEYNIPLPAPAAV